MRTGQNHFILTALCCCLLVAPGVLSTCAGGTTTAEITARVSLVAYNVTATGITSSTADITWMTNGQANSTVEYGPTIAYGFSKNSSEMVFSHGITLDGLSAGQEYHFRVGSSDSAGNTCISPDSTFTTDSMKMANAKILGGMPVVEFMAGTSTLPVDSGDEIPLTADNLVREPVYVMSDDGSASLSIDPGTRLLGGDGLIVNRIGLTRITAGDISTGQENTSFVFTGYAYRIDPTGAIFSPPLALKITPAPGDWEKISGKELLVHHFNPVSGRWEAQSTTADPSSHTVTSTVTTGRDLGLFSGPVLSVSSPSTAAGAGIISQQVVLGQEGPGGVNQTVVVYQALDIIMIIAAVFSTGLYFYTRQKWT